jgi:hypothetical protein
MAGRGAYDTTIREEIRRHGRQAPSSRAEEAGQTNRDEAVRRMNIRRGKRTGQGASANSTAYTPDRETKRGKGGGRDGGRGGPDKKGPGEKKKKLPVVKTPPWGVPGYEYTDPGDTSLLPPGKVPPEGPIDPTSPITGPDGIALPVGPELLPLLAAVGIRPRVQPPTAAIDQTIRNAVQGQGGNVVDAEYEVLGNEPRIAPPAQAPNGAVAAPAPEPQRALPAPAPNAAVTPDQRMLPSPTDVPMELIPDEMVKQRVRVPAGRRVIDPRIKVRVQ